MNSNSTTALGNRLVAGSAALAVIAALLFWLFSGADMNRLPVVLAAGVVAALVAYFAPLMLVRVAGLPPGMPLNMAIGTGAWALAIGVGAGWPAQDVVGLIVGTSVLAFIFEYIRRATTR